MDGTMSQEEINALLNNPSGADENPENTLEEISHNIFALLRKADKCNAELILVEGVETTGLGLAIMNRLIRACAHEYIKI